MDDDFAMAKRVDELNALPKDPSNLFAAPPQDKLVGGAERRAARLRPDGEVLRETRGKDSRDGEVCSHSENLRPICGRRWEHALGLLRIMCSQRVWPDMLGLSNTSMLHP